MTSYWPTIGQLVYWPAIGNLVCVLVYQLSFVLLDVIFYRDYKELLKIALIFFRFCRYCQLSKYYDTEP